METSFRRSLLYSTILHALILLLLYFLFGSFKVIRTPLLMELTLIGQMSKGDGLGAPAAKPGDVSDQAPSAESSGEFSAPQKPAAVPPPPSRPRPDVAVKKPAPPRKDPGTASSEAYLESLRRTAPIGVAPKRDDDRIHTTAGLGSSGVAGSPEGSAEIEGELAARAIKHKVYPDYPEWAKRQAIESVIRFHLTVLPNGLLKVDALQLEQTSGYRDLDQRVYEALIQWVFEPLAPSSPQVDQSGIITFHFDLKD